MTLPPAVSIIICTRNRADSLVQTIQSIGRCQVPIDLRTELLVIDNGSTDHTHNALGSIKLPNIPLSYFHESTPGQSRARNRGLAEACGRIILFTDDDVRVPTNWIQGICRPILEGSADAIAGGVIFPPHLDDQVRVRRSWFASTESIIPQHPDRFVGANMAFARSILNKVPAFDTHLGPGALGFGDDTLFACQLLHAGFRLTTKFDIAVEHHFDPTRLTRRHMIDMARQMGQSKAYVDFNWRHATIDPQPLRELGDRRRLWTERLLHPQQSLGSEQPSEKELHLIEHLAMRQYHFRLAANSPSYEKNGLVKIGYAAAA